MTLIGAIVFLVIFAVVAYLAHWIITNFFPAPAKVPALAIVGVLLLLWLAGTFWPEVASFRLWK